MYQTLLFDLDGTIIDSSLGITNSVAYALEKMGRAVPDKKDLLPFIGPPLSESFQGFCGLTEEESQQAISFYREYFAEKGIFENRLYPGIEEVLTQLKQAGKQILLATSKPEPFAIQILEYFGIDHYFTGITGASMDGSRNAKADVIALTLQRATITDVQTCLMIGDREHDILGAKAHQMDSLGVLYGFGSKSELEEAGATHIIEKPLEILSLLKKP